MELTKGTLVAAIILVCLALGVSFLRKQLIDQRTVCGNQMVEISSLLKEFASTHHGKLPNSKTELNDTLSKYAGSYAGPIGAELAMGPFYRSKGKPVPYLWDVSPHIVIGAPSKYHVLYTNGDVILTPDMPKAQPQL